MSTTTATFTVGQRVGIVTGVQSVNGPHVYMHGTVVRTIQPWGTVEYVVKAEDGSELVYPAYLLRPVTVTLPELSEAEFDAIASGAAVELVDCPSCGTRRGAVDVPDSGPDEQLILSCGHIISWVPATN